MASYRQTRIDRRNAKSTQHEKAGDNRKNNVNQGTEHSATPTETTTEKQETAGDSGDKPAIAEESGESPGDNGEKPAHEGGTPEVAIRSAPGEEGHKNEEGSKESIQDDIQSEIMAPAEVLPEERMELQRPGGEDIALRTETDLYETGIQPHDNGEIEKMKVIHLELPPEVMANLEAEIKFNRSKMRKPVIPSDLIRQRLTQAWFTAPASVDAYPVTEFIEKNKLSKVRCDVRMGEGLIKNLDEEVKYNKDNDLMKDNRRSVMVGRLILCKFSIPTL